MTTADQERFERKLMLERLKLDDSKEALQKDDADITAIEIDRLSKSIQYLKAEMDVVMTAMMDVECSIQEIRTWKTNQSIQIEEFLTLKTEMGTRLDELQSSKEARKAQLEEKIILEKQASHDRILSQRIQMEKELLATRMQMESQYGGVATSTTTVPQSVKLQRYTITPFRGDYKDWLRFWNQFSVEIDQSGIAEISKFNYLLELLRDKPRDDILGLPHTVDGYNEAKRILLETYGKDIKVRKALIKELESLHSIKDMGRNERVHEFYNKLSRIVRTLKTMDKLASAESAVYTLLDKLGPVREVLAQADDNWEEWGLEQLVENLRKYVDRNPLTGNGYRRHTQESEEQRHQHRRRNDQLYTTGEEKKRKCVFCNNEHWSSDCAKMKTVSDRKRFFIQKKMCFNCGGEHKISECRSKRLCLKCKSRHHTALCDRDEKSTRSDNSNNHDPMMLTPKQGVIYPVAVARVNGQLCRIFLDTGTGGRYASSTLINLTNPRYVGSMEKKIQMLLHSTEKAFEQYELQISSLDGNFEMNAIVTKVNKPDILQLENPRYGELIKQYEHLSDVNMLDTSTKESLPVHLILGSGDFAKLKTATTPKVGRNLNDPVAEYTKLGWVIYSPGDEDEVTHLNLIKSCRNDYEQLCSLDVLGIADDTGKDDDYIYTDFCEQLEKTEDGKYETGLIWKPIHPKLPTNETRSKARLLTLLKKLERDPERLRAYDEIIQGQLRDGIVEEVTSDMISNKSMQFFIPHKMVTKEDSLTTKHRIVFDASAKENDESPSLNQCLETGPSLQNLIWDILVKVRFSPIILAGDLKQAFLQVKIREEDRNFLQFHWIKDVLTKEITVLRFTRALFGLVQSPFLLGATIKYHLQGYKERYPKIVADIEKNLYVDDLIQGACTTNELSKFKECSTQIFKDAGFTLHKWNSNQPDLEEEDAYRDDNQTFAKQQLAKDTNSRLLGIAWYKSEDMLAIQFPQIEVPDTKRGVLKYLASIYDPLGLISPIVLQGKVIFRDVCEARYGWDDLLNDYHLHAWKKFKSSLTQEISLKRAIPTEMNQVKFVDLHTFSDASNDGTAAVVYAVVHQELGIYQGIVAAKSRLSKKMTIPRLELNAAHLGAVLSDRVHSLLGDITVRHNIVWSDSTTALHWIKGNGEKYKQFVRNQIRKISEKKVDQWRYVPGNMNPADVASRGGTAAELGNLWWNGPEWIAYVENWPERIITKPTTESESEAKKIREMLTVAIPSEDIDVTQSILSKFELKKTIRIFAWICRFVKNCRKAKDQRTKGTIKTEEYTETTKIFIRQAQKQSSEGEVFKKHVTQLNLVKNDCDIYICKGRIQGDYPIYIPADSILAEKIVNDAHLRTLHGGVGLTMTLVRERYWIPCLRKLVKKIRRTCFGCKRQQARPLSTPKVGPLPQDRISGSRPFQVIGLDYAGPFVYKKTVNTKGKAYILLFACSLTRAICLELVPAQDLQTFLPCLKQFIARRGRPDKIYSDNFSTFIAASKWLRTAVKSETVHDYLSTQNIKWQFNMSRAPWWGGQFERMVGLVKNALYKVVRKSTLNWREFTDVLLDVELTLNNRPLSYVEDDIQMPILTPNIMLFGQQNYVPGDSDAENIEDKDLRKRAKFLNKYKDDIWKRWRNEYLRGLRERHNMKHSGKESSIKEGDVVIIKGDVPNRYKWKLGVVSKLINGRDGVLRGAKLQCGRDHLERAIEHLYPMELHCDVQCSNKDIAIKEDRPRRNAAAIASCKIRDQSDDYVAIE